MTAIQTSLIGGRKKGDKTRGEEQQSLWNKVVQGDTTKWYCQYCQECNDNDVEPRDLLEKWFDNEKFHDVDESDMNKIYDSGVIICSKCDRPRRRATYGRVVLEKISYNIALVSIIPIIV